MQNVVVESDYLEVEDAAKVLHVTPRTIYSWRMARTGPPAYKVGRRLLFRKADLERWVLDRGSAVSGAA